MAFQIKDYLFDYGNEKIGKPTGIDIKEQKMTLPLIYVLNKVYKKEKSGLINSVKNHNNDKKRVIEVISFVKKQGGLHYAVDQMKKSQQEYMELLDPLQPTANKNYRFLHVDYVM